jgi:polyhydroxyalkanoate synthesis repressor PhaR
MVKKKKAEDESDAILIKRHGNRRLYNTETKSYVNYEDLADIVRDGYDIRVVDSKTNEDVTKAILIQVILEEEKKDSSVLPTDLRKVLCRTSSATIYRRASRLI